MNILGMRFNQFWLAIDKETNLPDLDVQSKVIFRTLDHDYGVVCIEIEDGILVMHSDEDTEYDL